MLNARFFDAAAKGPTARRVQLKTDEGGPATARCRVIPGHCVTDDVLPCPSCPNHYHRLRVLGEPITPAVRDLLCNVRREGGQPPLYLEGHPVYY